MMYGSAGLDSKGVSNHSLRTTGISRMYAEGIPEKMIMERSGHLSSSGVRSYEPYLEFQLFIIINDRRYISNYINLQERSISSI